MGSFVLQGNLPVKFPVQPELGQPFPFPSQCLFPWSTGHSQAQGNGNDKKRVGLSPFFPPSRVGDSSPQKLYRQGSSSPTAEELGSVGMKEKVFADPAKKSKLGTSIFRLGLQDPTIIFVG